MPERSIEELTAEIRARYGIAGGGVGPGRFPVLLIRPSHYDADGYVIQWFRSASSSGATAAMQTLVQDSLVRKVLGAEVQTEFRWIEEEARRMRPERLAHQLQNGRGLVILVGVSPSRFARAMDIALPLRVSGVSVCMEGFFVSSGVALQDGVIPELQEAMNLGISLFVGQPTPQRIDDLVRDAWRGRLKPIYNCGERSAPAGTAPPPMAATRRARSGTGPALRLSPFDCTFSTVVNLRENLVPGPTHADDLERTIRTHLRKGVNRFLLADRDLSRYPDWEQLFDRLIAMREQEQLDIQCTLQIDMACHRLPGLMEKAARAGVRGVFLDMDLRRRQNSPDQQTHEPSISAYRTVLLEWKRAGMIVFARYAIGGEGKAPEAVPAEIRMLQRELPIDVLEPFWVPTRGDDAWASAGHDAWKEFYTREHMEKVLRRAVATGTDVQDLTAVLLWFHFSVFCEKVEPLWGGSWRRKHRRDRRPSMQMEDPLSFYTSYTLERIYRQVWRAALYWRFRRFVKRLQDEPGSMSYTDPALDPANASGILLPQLPLTR
ncbi:MAG TPA: hypothetical protein VHZ09_12485 [Acidobacteriaceae bacterium]|jgi:hypothetical protein|nr:hypothetical protein [Acidobacteriaceae bacterium]